MIQDLIKSLRAEDLDKLRNGVFSSGAGSQPQCYIISGKKGIGRKALINQLRESMDSDGEAILWVDPSRLKEEPDLQKYHNLIPQCIKTNIPLLKSRADQAAIEIGREMHKVDAQIMQGSGATDAKDQETPAQVWGRVFKEHFLALDAQDSAPGSDHTKAIVLIENFETFNGQQQLWLKEFLIDQLQESCPADQISYIITTAAGEEKNIQKFFPDSKFRSENITLVPLTETETEELLLQLSLPEVPIADFYQQTEGIPSKVEELANSLLKADVDETAMSSIEAFLAGKTEEQLQWITVVVHLPEFSEEGLRLYLDEDGAHRAYEWLNSQSQLIVSSASGDKVFDPNLKNTLIRWMRKADPEQFKTLSDISAKYTKIVRKFSTPQSRTYLDHLSCLNFFSNEDLQHLFEDSADNYIHFVNDNPQYFEVGTGKNRVLNQYQELVSSYRELVPSTDGDTISSRASEFWQKKSADLKNQLQSLKAKKSLEEAKLGDLLEQRSTLEVFLDTEEDAEQEAKEQEECEKAEKLKRIQEEKQAEVDRKVKRSRFWHSLFNNLLLILGLASFYFGILVKEMAVMPMTFGVCLIALGFLRPFRKKVTIKTSKIESKVEKFTQKEKNSKGKKSPKKDKAKEAVTEEPVSKEPSHESLVLDDNSGARYVLEFKREKLSSREDDIQAQIEELSNTLKEVEQMLAEPLVA